MNLNEYFLWFPRAVRGREIARVAKAARVTPESIRSYRQSRRHPSPETAIRLVKATGGKVTLRDLIREDRLELVERVASELRRRPAKRKA